MLLLEKHLPSLNPFLGIKIVSNKEEWKNRALGNF